MIGLLFTNGKLDKYSTIIQSMLKNTKFDTDTIVTFTIDNINFLDKTFYGNIIHKESILPATLKLPHVIFNLSYQYKNINIKKLRKLSELNDIFFINESNKYNQLTIMNILASSNIESKYLVPFSKSSKDTMHSEPLTLSNLLMMPEKGASKSKIIYFEKDNLYSNSPNIGKNEYLNFEVPKNYSLTLNTPKLLTFNKSILIFRSYVQKGENAIWKFLTSKVNIKDVISPQNYIDKLNNAAVDIIDYINKFIPDLGNSFIDFVIDVQGNLHFLHLGGWDYHLLKILTDKHLQESYLNNLFNYAKYCNSKTEEDSYVD